MCKYTRPDFIKEGKGFSIVYFSKAIKFLIVQGALEDFFLDSFNLKKIDYDKSVERLISMHPELKICFIESELSIHDKNDDVDLSLQQTELSTKVSVSNYIIELRFESQFLKDIFLAPYEHLKTSKKSDFMYNKLSVFEDKRNLYLCSNFKILSKSLKKEYYNLQAQFANKIIEYYHNLESNQWLCSFHACAVKKSNKTYLILGDSGAGKSTLTALLCASGYRFVGDDLILMDQEFNVYDNPAALSAKQSSWGILSKYYNEMHEINESNRTKGKVKMKYLSIHSIQKNLPEKHKISALFWVDFNPNAKAQLKPLTSFNISSSLIPDTWVNPELNYSELFTNWLIQSKGYRLIYSDFSSLVNVLDEQL